jgi:hypothetical protein
VGDRRFNIDRALFSELAAGLGTVRVTVTYTRRTHQLVEVRDAAGAVVPLGPRRGLLGRAPGASAHPGAHAPSAGKRT